MRRIKSEKEIQIKQRRMQLIVGIVMVSLLVFATAGWFASELFGSDQDTSIGENVNYGGRTFLRQNNVWTSEIQGKQFYFFDLPNESRNIYLNESLFTEYSGKPLYVVNPEPEFQLILLNLKDTYERTQVACLDSEDCEENLPLKDCSSNVIAFFKSNETKVEKNESCIFIYGDFEKGVDAFSYNLLKIK